MKVIEVITNSYGNLLGFQVIRSNLSWEAAKFQAEYLNKLSISEQVYFRVVSDDFDIWEAPESSENE